MSFVLPHPATINLICAHHLLLLLLLTSAAVSSLALLPNVSSTPLITEYLYHTVTAAASAAPTTSSVALIILLSCQCLLGSTASPFSSTVSLSTRHHHPHHLHLQRALSLFLSLSIFSNIPFHSGRLQSVSAIFHSVFFFIFPSFFLSSITSIADTRPLLLATVIHQTSGFVPHHLVVRLPRSQLLYLSSPIAQINQTSQDTLIIGNNIEKHRPLLVLFWHFSPALFTAGVIRSIVAGILSPIPVLSKLSTVLSACVSACTWMYFDERSSSSDNTQTVIIVMYKDSLLYITVQLIKCSDGDQSRAEVTDKWAHRVLEAPNTAQSSFNW